MPIPVYLICSESGAVDEASKRTSIFNLIEKLRFFRLPPEAMAYATQVQLASYWLRESGDDDIQFEVQFTGIFPNVVDEVEFARMSFKFNSESQKIGVAGIQFNQLNGSGVLQIEARVRRAGEEKVLGTIKYPILIEEVPLPPGFHLPGSQPQTK
jgi:hypothetical protein